MVAINPYQCHNVETTVLVLTNIINVDLLLSRLWSAALWSPCALISCLRYQTARKKLTPKLLGCHGYIPKSLKVMKEGEGCNHLFTSVHYYLLPTSLHAYM